MNAPVLVTGALRLRHATEGDAAFLRHLYETTREAELAGVSWGDRTRQAFLDQQFRAQATDYRRRFPDGSQYVVEVEGLPVGRLYVADDGDAVRVLDVALLPERRGTGTGEALLRWVLSSGRRVVLNVARGNRAQSLYRRLGFVVVDDSATHLRMECAPLS